MMSGSGSGKDLVVVQRAVGELKAADYNPRQLSDTQRGQIEESLKRFGFVDPVIVNMHPKRKNVIVGGHQRVKVAAALGYTDVPCVEVRLTEKQERELNIRLNKNTGEWDFEMLREHFDKVDLTAWGFTDEELAFDDDDEEVKEDDGGKVDKADELRDKWGVKTGQVWELGQHRLLCGDATKAEDVARVMDGGLASLVVTDPPYGVSYADKNAFLNNLDKGNCCQTNIENDHLDKEATQAMWKAAFAQMSTAMDKGAVVYCFMPQGGDQMMMMMMMMMMGAGIEPRHELIWLKNNHVLGRTDYAYKHEPILYAWKAGGHKFYGDFQTSILEFDKPVRSDLHPTMKPIPLICKLIKNSSRKTDVVYEPFSGSGTTLMACEQLGRRCRAVEISPGYVAVAIERWAEATGKEPRLIG